MSLGCIIWGLVTSSTLEYIVSCFVVLWPTQQVTVDKCPISFPLT